jgi:hypothetical protein
VVLVLHTPVFSPQSKHSLGAVFSAGDTCHPVAGVVAHGLPFQVGYDPSDGDDLLRKGKDDGLCLNFRDADEALFNAPVALFDY